MKKIDCPRAGVVFCIVAFAISAAAQNTFPATGNVGIGTTSPHNSLELSGGAVDFYNPGAWVAVGMDYDPSTDTFRFRSNNASDNLNQTNISIQRVSGNVGIGTSSPHSLLDLSSQTQGSDRIRLSGLEFNWGQTSTDGIAMRVGININRPGNRQLWVADSAAAINTTNAQLRFLVGSGAGYAAVDSVSTDGSTYTNLSLNPVGGMLASVRRIHRRNSISLGTWRLTAVSTSEAGHSPRALPMQVSIAVRITLSLSM